MSDSTTDQPSSVGRFEIIAGVTIALFAAILAINELGAGKYGDDEIMLGGKKTEAWNWYQSKSVKQSLVEGQRDLLNTLILGGLVDAARVGAMTNVLAKWEADIGRYKKEKKEIMLGSAAVGKEGWIQDVDGELGKVVGAKEYEQRIERLGAAGDIFDVSTLQLQVALVFGAISIVLSRPKLKWTFYSLMVALGAGGAAFCFRAYHLAAG